MLYFHITINFSAFRSALFRKSCIRLPLKSNKCSQIKNDNSCKVPISCTGYIILFSKAQQPNEKHRLAVGSVTVSEHEIKPNSWVFDMHDSPSV